MATFKQIELGMAVAAASRQLGVSEQAIYRWKKVYGGLQSNQVRQLELLQEENVRLKKLVAVEPGQGDSAGHQFKKWPGPL